MAKQITPLPKETDAFGREFVWEPIEGGGFRAWLADRSMCVGLESKDKKAAMDAFAAFLPKRLQAEPKQEKQTVCPRCGLNLEGYE